MYGNYPRQVLEIGPFVKLLLGDIEKLEIRLMTNACFNLWDCSGSEEAFKLYLSQDGKDSELFKDTSCLVYVFDLSSPAPSADLVHFEAILEALRLSSPDALVYVLLHKTDLISPQAGSWNDSSTGLAQKIVRERRQEIEKRALPTLVHTFHTSIWDETLYKGWSSVFHALLPNVKRMEERLVALASEHRADEIVLFDSSKFLVLAQAIRHQHSDHHRHEKVSNIIKQFYTTCARKGLHPTKFTFKTDAGVLVVIEKMQTEDAILMATTRHHHLPSLASVQLLS